MKWNIWATDTSIESHGQSITQQNRISLSYRVTTSYCSRLVPILSALRNVVELPAFLRDQVIADR